jgi:hypothetical protein
MEEEKHNIEIIDLLYQSSNDEEIINDRIEALLNSNNLFSEQMKKMDIYRTEFYNIFYDPKTKWLIQHNHVRLYIREDYEDIKYTHYIPIGYVKNVVSMDDDTDTSCNETHNGIITSCIYTEIVNKFKDFFTKDHKLNTNNYSIGYIFCGNDIIAITLKHINIKYESKDAFMIHCNKMIKFAKEYICNNKECE